MPLASLFVGELPGGQLAQPSGPVPLVSNQPPQGE
jgi:hypothetical protein